MFTLSAVLGFFFGLGFLLFPAMVMSTYGLTDLAPVTTYFIRIVGGSFIGFSTLAWLVRNEPDSNTRQNILFAYFVSYLLILVVMFYDQVTNPVSALAWVNIVLQAFMTVGFGYVRFMKSE
jgi:hypothetical protein